MLGSGHAPAMTNTIKRTVAAVVLAAVSALGVGAAAHADDTHASEQALNIRFR